LICPTLWVCCVCCHFVSSLPISLAHTGLGPL
jgi:hypothetical protein